MISKPQTRFGRVEVCVWSPTKKNNKSRAEQEPRSAHGRAVNNKSRAEQEPRSAHGRAVNKSRVKQEPRSAHGRAVNNKNNKSRAEQEPRSAHGRAVNNMRYLYSFLELLSYFGGLDSIYLTFRLGARVFYDRIVNKKQLSLPSLIENEGE